MVKSVHSEIISMQFRYTEKIGYFLMILSLLAPFYVMVQQQTSDIFMIMIMGPCWQFIWQESPYFAVSPLVLLFYLPFWGPGLYIGKIAYDAAKTQNMVRYDYVRKIVTILIIQILLLIYFTLASGGYPEPIDFPLPVVGVVALLLTKMIVKEPTKPWEEEKELDFLTKE
jgi:hypothetical protein